MPHVKVLAANRQPDRGGQEGLPTPLGPIIKQDVVMFQGPGSLEEAGQEPEVAARLFQAAVNRLFQPIYDADF